MEEMKEAFRKYRFKVASAFLEGETEAHWRQAYRHADDLIRYSDFCAGWDASRDALTEAQARNQ